MMRIKTIISVLCLSFAAVLPVVAQQVKYKASKHYNQKVASFAIEPMPSSDNIVMLGDSHTEFGEDWNAKLHSRYGIINRGIIGDDAKGILNRLCQVCPGKPKAIFFECGANDLSHGLTVNEVAKGVIRTIEAIRRQSPESCLFVQSVFPINESFGRWKTLAGKADMIPQINKQLEAYCKRKNIVYIDVFRLLVEPETNTMRKEICRDGLHLLPSGYEIWAAEVQRYIDKYGLGM